jgi:hypothetical protein
MERASSWDTRRIQGTGPFHDLNRIAKASLCLGVQGTKPPSLTFLSAQAQAADEALIAGGIFALQVVQ